MGGSEHGQGPRSCDGRRARWPSFFWAATSAPILMASVAVTDSAVAAAEHPGTVQRFTHSGCATSAITPLDISDDVSGPSRLWQLSVSIGAEILPAAKEA
jgi:hypothetical protein